MKTLTKIIPLAVSLFFIILFIYAAASKMLDFENFQVQLAQSPLLSAYAGFVSYGVIILELAIGGLLCFHASRLLGLYASFAIMIAFTVYIFLILNYSDFVPCSCGGILEKMSWTEHLIFNIGCVVMAGLAIILAYHLPAKLSVLDHSEEDWMKNYGQRRRSSWMLAYKMATLLVLPSGLMVALFLSSEHIMKKENNFTRRFPPHPIIEEKSYDLKVNSYYFAGYSRDTIYLGNYSTPFIITKIDTSFRGLKKLYVKPPMSQEFLSPKLEVVDNHYYLSDGTIPIIYQGKVEDSSGKIQVLSNQDIYFNRLVAQNSHAFVIRSTSSNSGMQAIGVLDLFKRPKVTFSTNFLTKQIDGTFDSDGKLLYDKHMKRIYYIYTYRNQIVSSDQNLENITFQKTIDPINKPQIKVTTLSNGTKKMAQPPMVVNNNSTVYRGLVFNESKMRGKYESEEKWLNNSIIDVYKTNPAEYWGSFYVHQYKKSKLTQMLVTDQYLWILIENKIIRYRIAHAITENFAGEKPKTHIRVGVN